MIADPLTKWADPRCMLAVLGSCSTLRAGFGRARPTVGSKGLVRAFTAAAALRKATAQTIAEEYYSEAGAGHYDALLRIIALVLMLVALLSVFVMAFRPRRRAILIDDADDVVALISVGTQTDDPEPEPDPGQPPPQTLGRPPQTPTAPAAPRAATAPAAPRAVPQVIFWTRAGETAHLFPVCTGCRPGTMMTTHMRVCRYCEQRFAAGESPAGPGTTERGGRGGPAASSSSTDYRRRRG